MDATYLVVNFGPEDLNAVYDDVGERMITRFAVRHGLSQLNVFVTMEFGALSVL